MTTRTVELAEATLSLAEYVEHIDDDVLIVMRDGHPIAAMVALPNADAEMVALPNADAETVALSHNPHFRAIIERSRARQTHEGGITSAEMRRRLGITVDGEEPTE